MNQAEAMDADHQSEKKDDFKAAEREEEAKLKNKYPQVTRPGPQLLQKRLQKGQKYFDSGDYNMAKSKGLVNNKTRLPSTLSQPPPPSPPTGDTIPTPELLPTRKTSIHIQSKLVSGAP